MLISASRGAHTVPGVLAGETGTGPASWASPRASSPITMKLPLANGCEHHRAPIGFLSLPTVLYYVQLKDHFFFESQAV